MFGTGGKVLVFTFRRTNFLEYKMQKPNTFADAFNYFMYDGVQVIKDNPKFSSVGNDVVNLLNTFTEVKLNVIIRTTILFLVNFTNLF
jgi:hypothetical protein